jgi:hypothetical protein
MRVVVLIKMVFNNYIIILYIQYYFITGLGVKGNNR